MCCTFRWSLPLRCCEYLMPAGGLATAFYPDSCWEQEGARNTNLAQQSERPVVFCPQIISCRNIQLSIWGVGWSVYVTGWHGHPRHSYIVYLYCLLFCLMLAFPCCAFSRSFYISLFTTGITPCLNLHLCLLLRRYLMGYLGLIASFSGTCGMWAWRTSSSSLFPALPFSIPLPACSSVTGNREN